MKTLKYKEKYIYKSPEGRCIKFVPLPSGGTIGGVVWKIRYKMLRILYISRPYMRSEMISDGLSLQELPQLSDIVIIDSNIIQGIDNAKENKREIKRLVREQITHFGTVVIPCDSGSRGLELLSSMKRLVDKEQEKPGPIPKIFYLHTMSDRALEVARFHLEWMSSKFSTAETSKGNEIEFIEDSKLFCATSLAQYSTVPKEGTRIVFCTHASLNYGLSSLLLRSLIDDPNALFIFPFTSPYQTLAWELIRNDSYSSVELTVPQRTKIENLVIHPEPMIIERIPEPESKAVPEEKKIFQRTNILFKNKPFLCFDDSKRKIKSDDFGDIISETKKLEWKKLNPGDDSENNNENNKLSIEDTKAIIARLRKPEYSDKYSFEYSKTKVIPKAKFKFINYEGIYDKLSFRLILKYLQPKRAILFNTDPASQQSLQVIY